MCILFYFLYYLELYDTSVTGTIYGCDYVGSTEEYVFQIDGSVTSSTNLKIFLCDDFINSHLDLDYRHKVLGFRQNGKLYVYDNDVLLNSRTASHGSSVATLPAYISACYRQVSASQNPGVVRKLSMKLYELKVGEGVPDFGDHLFYNGNAVKHLVYNGNAVDHLVHNGNNVF